jgi:nucleotidyltransferase substrate binding protein (TIGR01987 family)
MPVDFTALDKALGTLDAALTPPPRNDRERDGAIQRFEYTFELAWKTAKKVLAEAGIDSQSPKSVIRDLGQQGLLEDIEKWFGFLRARNATRHTYNDTTADQVFEQTQLFAMECRRLVGILKTTR